jgi:predicted transcriptional regulator
MMKMEDALVKEAHVILHPIRFRLVELLAEKPMHVSEISRAMGEERRLVAYHLDTLEEYGFVKSKHEISEQPKSKGKALRIYWTTDKVKTVIAELKKM